MANCLEDESHWLSEELNRLFYDVVRPPALLQSHDEPRSQPPIWEFTRSGTDGEYHNFIPKALLPNDETQESIWQDFSKNGRDSEYCPDLTWSSSMLTSLEQQPLGRGCRAKEKRKQSSSSTSPPPHCVFCKNNGEAPSFYQSHVLKERCGRVICPVLRAYTCPICKATGDLAHTIKYCPKNRSGEVTAVGSVKTSRTAAGKLRRRV